MALDGGRREQPAVADGFAAQGARRGWRPHQDDPRKGLSVCLRGRRSRRPASANPNPLAPAPSASDLGNPAVSFPDDPVPGNEPVVVVIDNDPNIREAIYGLLRSVGLRAECFATVREFTDSVPPSPPVLLDPRCLVAGPERLGLSSAVGQGERSHTGHLRQRPCRRSRSGSSDESGSVRVPDQTRASRGVAERRESGDSVVNRSAGPTRRKEDGGLNSEPCSAADALPRKPRIALPPRDARKLGGADPPLHESAPHFSDSRPN